MSSSVLSEYITPAQLADELGVTVRTLRLWQQRRVGPPITRIGKRVMYARASVRDWLLALEQRRDTGRRRASHSRATVAA
jgi:DNA-binding transcriptional MerR regulator